MKKKSMAVLLMMSMAVGMAGCGSKNTNSTTDTNVKTDASASTSTANTTSSSSSSTTKNDSSASGYELALVTDVGTIDDKSFNQGAWEGLKKYAEEKSVTYKYYQPTEKTTAAYIETIGLAVEGGAKLIVCPGYLFEPAVYECQDTYPDVKFILLDGVPHPEDDATNIKCNDNVYAVSFAEEQAGFLAGYAAVKDGYTDLGFMGGMALPAVMRYGYGYVQGADYAAKELNVDNINLKYTYTGGFTATPEVQSTAASWYNDGTQVIFGCGGGLGNSVMSAADTAGTKMIGVDVDQRPESETVITSAMKNLGIAVYNGIDDFYNNSFPGGTPVVLDATTEAVQLPMDDSQFTKFTQADYDAVYEKIVSGEIPIKKDANEKGDPIDIKDIDKDCANVTVNFVE